MSQKFKRCNNQIFMEANSKTVCLDQLRVIIDQRFGSFRREELLVQRDERERERQRERRKKERKREREIKRERERGNGISVYRKILGFLFLSSNTPSWLSLSSPPLSLSFFHLLSDFSVLAVFHFLSFIRNLETRARARTHTHTHTHTPSFSLFSFEFRFPHSSFSSLSPSPLSHPYFAFSLALS